MSSLTDRANAVGAFLQDEKRRRAVRRNLEPGARAHVAKLWAESRATRDALAAEEMELRLAERREESQE